MAVGKLFTIIAASVVLTVGLSTLSAWGVASMVVGTAATSSVSGVHGSAGTNGANGKDGATGTPGANGTTGPTGEVGAPGAKGTPAAQGIAGAIGPVGPAGAGGPAGPTGASGASAPSFSFVSSGGTAFSPPGLPFPVGSLVTQVPAGTALVGFSVALAVNAPIPPTPYYCQLVDDLGGVLATSATLNIGGSSNQVVFATTQVVSLPTATHLTLQCVNPPGFSPPVDYTAVSIYAISFA